MKKPENKGNDDKTVNDICIGLHKSGGDDTRNAHDTCTGGTSRDDRKAAVRTTEELQQDPHTFPEFSNRPPPHCFLRVLPSPLAIHRLHHLSFRHFPTTES